MARYVWWLTWRQWLLGQNGEYLSDQYDGGLSRTSSRGSMGRAPSGNIGGPDEWMRGPKGGPGIPPMGGPPGSMGPGGPMGRQGETPRTHEIPTSCLSHSA